MSAGSRYEALLPIGTGGMATVYVGRPVGSEGLSHLVALKRAHAYLRTDAQLVENMKLEARLASRLHHPNVVSVLDVDEIDGDLVLVLDYVEGCTLRTLLAKLEQLGERRPREIVRIILDVAAGLHAAHLATDEDGRLLGLVHRDISPSNVLVGVDGMARLSDFGIAKALFEGSDRTEAGVLKGKSSYMAPEYVLHQHANASSDLFSLAVVAWESLAHVRLFKGSSEIETFQRIVAAEIRPLSGERPELAPLDLVLAKALSRLPSDRHRSVEQFAIELEEVARRNDLVASHAEVSTLVQRVAKTELDERRQALLARAEKEAETVVASLPMLPRPEELAAAMLAETGLPPSSRAPRPGVDPRSSIDALPAIDPRPSIDASPAVDPRPSVDARMSDPRWSVPSGPRSAAQITTSRRAAAARTIGGAPPDQASLLLERRRRRAKELLALVGAFALLGLALTAMAIQIENTPPIEEAPFASPTPSPTSPAPEPVPALDAGVTPVAAIDAGTLLGDTDAASRVVGDADAAAPTTSASEPRDAATPSVGPSSSPRSHSRASTTEKKTSSR